MDPFAGACVRPSRGSAEWSHSGALMPESARTVEAVLGDFLRGVKATTDGGDLGLGFRFDSENESPPTFFSLFYPDLDLHTRKT